MVAYVPLSIAVTPLVLGLVGFVLGLIALLRGRREDIPAILRALADWWRR